LDCDPEPLPIYSGGSELDILICFLGLLYRVDGPLFRLGVIVPRHGAHRLGRLKPIRQCDAPFYRVDNIINRVKAGEFAIVICAEPHLT
jgi:hypothetical protein